MRQQGRSISEASPLQLAPQQNQGSYESSNKVGFDGPSLVQKWRPWLHTKKDDPIPGTRGVTLWYLVSSILA